MEDHDRRDDVRRPAPDLGVPTPAAVGSAARRGHALAHSVRARIFAALGEQEMSPVELADALGMRLGVVSYHVRVLAEAGVIELVRMAPRRGAIQHYYRRARGEERYLTSVELPDAVADELTGEIAAAIARAQDRGAAHPGRAEERVLVTVVLQPASPQP